MRNAWVYLVVLAVLTVAALFIFKLRSTDIPDEAAGTVSRLPTLGSLTERTIQYEAVGPAGTPATVSYLDDDGHNQNVDTVLPWQEALRTVEPSLVTSMVVQSNVTGVGCRITVNGKVRDEQVATATGGIASCKVQVA
ncbi:membrane protein [Mycobacteroides franklinii]|nr:membrane protein [Mycobacteroides franklinii]